MEDIANMRVDFRPKNVAKKGHFEFSWISARYLLVGFRTCTCVLLCQGECVQFSSLNLQWLTRFELNLLSTFWLAQLEIKTGKKKHLVQVCYIPGTWHTQKGIPSRMMKHALMDVAGFLG